jgi:zinc transport system substrate-binding protein
LYLFLFFIAGAGCRDQAGRPPSSSPLAVVSIFPVGDLAARLAGDAVAIEVLLPPGASPATFEVTPRQLRTLSTASLFIMVGGGLDEWVARLPATSGGDPTVVRLTEGLSLLHGEEHEEASGNPHIWLDPILVRDEVLPRLERALAAIAPDSSAAIASRRTAMADSLSALHDQIRGALEPLERRSFIATHPAWSYFARRYDLREVGVVHSHPGEEPSSREVAGLLELAREAEVHCVFTEPQLGEVAAQALASELSLPTCVLDPLGGPGLEERDGYLELLRFNTEQFVQGLTRGTS